MEDYLAESEIVYPSEEVLESGSSYAYLSEEISRYVESLYQKATKTADLIAQLEQSLAAMQKLAN